MHAYILLSYSSYLIFMFSIEIYLPFQLKPNDGFYPIQRGGGTPPLIIYNRVPKTGSTSFANIAYKLTSKNKFHMLHINTTYKNSHYLNILDQVCLDWSLSLPYFVCTRICCLCHIFINVDLCFLLHRKMSACSMYRTFNLLCFVSYFFRNL